VSVSVSVCVCVCVCVCAGVRPVGVDRQAAGAHERSSSVGRHPAGLPAGVGGHRVRLQPGDSHRLPAHPVNAGMKRDPSHTHTHTHTHSIPGPPVPTHTRSVISLDNLDIEKGIFFRPGTNRF